MEVPRSRQNSSRLTMANSQHNIDFALSLKNWAVVGLGNNPERAAYGVAKVLLDKGHHVIPIYPRAEVVHGQQGYATLAEVPEEIDVVDLFVNSSRVSEFVDQAIEIGAKVVWLQLDVRDDAAIARAEAAGLVAIFDRCPAIEYRKR